MPEKSSNSPRIFVLVSLLLLIFAWLWLRNHQQKKHLDQQAQTTESTRGQFPQKNNKTKAAKLPHSRDANIPQQALDIVEYVKTHGGQTKPGYKGNIPFGNREKMLPFTNQHGIKLKYKEYDIYPFKKGVNRGPKRVVIDSDGNAYYTKDHYKNFQPIQK